MSTRCVRWNLVVSEQLDRSVRQLLVAEGRSEDGELSRFVEEAVGRHLFDMAVRAVHEHNKDVDPKVIEDAVTEALLWARAKKKRGAGALK